MGTLHTQWMKTLLVLLLFLFFSVDGAIALGHGDYDCDNDEQCAGELICETCGALGGDGCCYDYENWNDIGKFCNNATYGKAFEVTTNLGGSFSEQPFSNLKLVFEIRDHNRFTNPFKLRVYGETFTGTQGDFNFNPEQTVGEFNWNTVGFPFYFNFQIDNIYAVIGNEIIGEWTNNFNNGLWEDLDTGYRLGEKTRHQIIRIHTDMPNWRKTNITKELNSMKTVASGNRAPELDLQMLDIQHINAQGRITNQKNQGLFSSRIEGVLIVKEEGEYHFATNLVGGLRILLDSKSLIDEWGYDLTTRERNFSTYLTIGNHSLAIDMYTDSGSPPFYFKWKTPYSASFEEIRKSVFIQKKVDFKYFSLERNGVKTLSYNEADSKNSLSLTDEFDNFQVSFLESPKVYYHNKNYNIDNIPIVLVHGLHGESGNWDNWYEYLTNLGYDVWQFYYPNDQENNYSAALMRDALDYITQIYSSSKVDVMSHSMGGLISRGYAEGFGVTPSGIPVPYNNNIRKLILVAGPYHGSYLSNRILNDDDLSRSGVVCDIIERFLGDRNRKEPAYTDLAVGSDFTWNLNKGGINPDINYFVIAGNEHILCVKYEADDNDGFVSVSSASLLNFGVPMVLIKQNHATELGRSTINPLVRVNITYLSLIVDAILNDANRTSIESLFEFDNEHYIDPDEPMSNPLGEGSVLIRTNKLQALSLDGYNLTSKPYTGVYYYYFDPDELGPGLHDVEYLEFGLTLKSGTYNLFINSEDSGYDIEVKPAQTTLLDLEKDFCSDGIMNGDELGIDCGGSCITQDKEVCNGLDDNHNCAIDEDLIESESCGLGICIGGQRERNCSIGSW
ncbi:MAG: alpha/beta fold hydrolase, partial [Candidatus Heimdallarchaeaceae archaeon]